MLEKEVDTFSKGCVPKNTAQSTIWAVQVFKEWIEQRKCCKEVYPSDILEKPYESNLVCIYLQQFVSEARRADGTQYPPKTLHQMLCALKECQPDLPNFLDRKDVHFKKLHSTCDVVFRSLHKSGIGTKKPVITKEDYKINNQLWETGVLNTTTHTGLQRAAILHWQGLLLEGGEEQRKLKPSKFTRLHNPERYEHTEHGSKNRNGGFYQLQVENKSVSMFKNDVAGERCLVYLLDLYLKSCLICYYR